MNILETYVRHPINEILQPYILPLVTKGIKWSKGSKVSISMAVALVSFYLLYDKVARPPSSLRHLPRVGFFTIIKAQLQRKSGNDISRELTIPIALESPEGIYVRFGYFGWAVHMSRPEASKRFLLKTETFPIRLGSSRGPTILTRLGNTSNMLALNGARWKSQRKVANPAFHRSMPLELFGRLMTGLFDVIDNTANQSKFSVDFHDLTTRWTLDVLGLVGFDFNFNAIADRNNEWVVRYTYIAENMLDPFFLLFYICDTTLLRFFPKRQRVHDELTKFLDMLDKVIANKRQILSQKHQSLDHIKENEKDLLTLMLEAGNEDGQDQLSDEELKENLSLFFIAGHDTTSKALACAVYYMAANQDVQKRARQCVIDILGDTKKDVVPTVEQLREIPYINMIIKETLRINPPLAQSTPRIAAKDTELCGTVIPKGTRVFTEIFELHHNPTVWKNPETFDPERFAPGGEAELLGSAAWQPFITGPRQCIGMNLSLAEQRVFLSMLLLKYEWTLPQDSIHKERLVTTGNLIVSPKDLNIEFKRRY